MDLRVASCPLKGRLTACLSFGRLTWAASLRTPHVQHHHFPRNPWDHNFGVDAICNTRNFFTGGWRKCEAAPTIISSDSVRHYKLQLWWNSFMNIWMLKELKKKWKRQQGEFFCAFTCDSEDCNIGVQLSEAQNRWQVVCSKEPELLADPRLLCHGNVLLDLRRLHHHHHHQHHHLHPAPLLTLPSTPSHYYPLQTKSATIFQLLPVHSFMHMRMP